MCFPSNTEPLHPNPQPKLEAVGLSLIQEELPDLKQQNDFQALSSF